MIDHTGVIVSDLAKSRAWYRAALAPMGYDLLYEATTSITGHTDVVGFGETATQKCDFWLEAATPTRPVNKPPIHVAFRVPSRGIVDAFHKAALAAGGRDNGVPGLRPHYHPDYYGAFVLDPDGHNIEAVCHEPFLMALPTLRTASVVIPAYNAAKTLDRTLASAVASLRHCVDVEGFELACEIIVVDDVSTDTTAEIVEEWTKREPAVRLIRNVVNRGPGFSRNEGVRRSTGWFLFFLDSDDVFYPNHIHLCVKELLADSALGYVFTRMKVDMPLHPDWVPSLDESNPINFCVRRVWHDMIQGFAEEPDFRTYRTEDTLYRKCLRDLVKHRKIDAVTCEQFISPGNALDRQRAKLAMSMAEWNRSGLDDGFVMTPQMEDVVKARLTHVAKLLGAKI